jgi:hypothetical protein
MQLRHYKWFILLSLVVGLGLGSPNLTAAHDEDEPPPAPGSTWEPETCTLTICGDVAVIQ